MKNTFLSIVSLLILCFSLKGVAQDIQQPNKWEDEVIAYEKLDSTSPTPPAPIIFTGSSSIRLWKDISSKFPGKKVVNRGIGGAELSDIIYHQKKLIFKYKPKKVFIYCGGNDIAHGKSPEKVLEDFKTLYRNIKSKLPNTKVYYISIQTSPIRWEMTQSFKRANELIKAYISNKTQDVYINVFDLLLDKEGKPKPEFFLEDKLHMNSAGYERWARVLKPFVDQ